MVKFNKKAFMLFLIIFIAEIIIALYVRDKIIRPYGGDALVIILLYTFLQSFLCTKPHHLILFVLAVAFITETAQLFKIADLLEIQNKIIRTVMGNSFSIGDFIAYITGAVLCIPVSKSITKKNNTSIHSNN